MWPVATLLDDTDLNAGKNPETCRPVLTAHIFWFNRPYFHSLDVCLRCVGRAGGRSLKSIGFNDGMRKEADPQRERVSVGAGQALFAPHRRLILEQRTRGIWVNPSETHVPVAVPLLLSFPFKKAFWAEEGQTCHGVTLNLISLVSTLTLSCTLVLGAHYSDRSSQLITKTSLDTLVEKG